MCNCHDCVMGLCRICTRLFWCGISIGHLFTSAFSSTHRFPAAQGFAWGLSPHRFLQFFVSFFPCDIITFFVFLESSLLTKPIFFFFFPNFSSHFFTSSQLSHHLLPISIHRYISVFLLYFHDSMIDSNTFPTLFHPCFFLEDRLGPPISLPPLIVCHSFSFHPSFFHLNHSQGDLCGAHLLLFPQSLLKSLRCHSYLKIHPFFPSGSIHRSNY